jgi:DNA mismatch repair protein MutS
MSDKETPMMRQYNAVRRELPPNTILLFRLGDFYEMFGDDAKAAAAIINVALTKRGTMPMCGVPYHAARGYIEKLIAGGKKVAICDQVGEVQAGKLVRRELSQVISAGTLDDFGLDERRQNYLAAICEIRGVFGIAYVDLSTGEFRLTEVESMAQLLDELARVSPAEIVIPDGGGPLNEIPNAQQIEGYVFDPDSAAHLLREHFRVQSLDGFGCAHFRAGVGAAGAILHYLSRQMRRNVAHLRTLKPYQTSEYLIIDAVTQTHLEIVQSRGGREMTLVGALDNTVTPVGARTLRDWMLHPLRSVESIRSRQEAVACLIADSGTLAALRSDLKGIRDLERALSRLSGSSGNARDLAVLASSLGAVPSVQDRLSRIATAPRIARFVRRAAGRRGG